MLGSHLLIFSYFFLLNYITFSFATIKTEYQWYFVDYLWHNEAHKIGAILSGNYNYSKPVIIDVDLWKDGRVFVTTVRTEGVPATLSIISDKMGPGGPLLQPYPNWSWTKLDCTGIVNVFRISIDKCDRLWVLDSGRIDEEYICPAQLLVFDLHSDELIDKIEIPDGIAKNKATRRGLLVTPIIQTEGQYCQWTNVFIADVLGSGLIMFNGTSFWRLESPIFAPQSKAETVEIANESFCLDDGILGMALSPKIQGRGHLLVFRPLASFDMILTESNDLVNSFGGNPVNYKLISNALPSQAVAMAFSSNGILFFGLTHDLAVACWNINKPLTKENIVLLDRDASAYQFMSGVKIIPSEITNDDEELWIVTNRYQKVALGRQNFNEINFRIMKRSVRQLIRGTNCEENELYSFISKYNIKY